MNLPLKSSYVLAQNTYELLSKVVPRSELSGRSLLDVGCRDCILKTYLDESVKYTGVDLYPPEDTHGVSVVHGNLEKKLPFKSNEFEFVAALDVLEHCDDIYHSFSELDRVSSRYIFINLPNELFIKYRLKLFFGLLSGKFKVSEVGDGDRHKWFFTHSNVKAFIKHIERNYDAEIELYYRNISGVNIFNRILLWLLRGSKSLGVFSYGIKIKKIKEGFI